MKKNKGFFRPRKMRHIELTVLAWDVDRVIELLGRRGIMHFSENKEGAPGIPELDSARALEMATYKHFQENLNKLQIVATYLEIPIPEEPEEGSRIPGEDEEYLSNTIISEVTAVSRKEDELNLEKKKIAETLNEAKAFSSLNVPFANLNQLSYLTLRVGRLDPRYQDEIKENLGDRAVIIHLDPEKDGTAQGDRVLAAASRKGRFALDSELKRVNFTPISIPENFKGVPVELLSGLSDRLTKIDSELGSIAKRKDSFRENYRDSLKSLMASYLMAGITEQLKLRMFSTSNAYLLSGWVPAAEVTELVDELNKLTEGRVAVRSFTPQEVPNVREGKEKVPVSLEHGAFIRGFEGVVFSFGAPLYGTIDPTFFVAVSFTVLFGIMFGDFGQGLVLFCLGILTGIKGPAILSGFRKFSVPLIAVGISSMIMGFLTGEFFTNEHFFTGATRALTGFLTGRPVDRILAIMPISEAGGSVSKLFYFFGFTLGIGVLLNSIGLVVNIINQFFLGEYEKALFSKTGAAGALVFWYAIFLALRLIYSMLNPGSPPFSFGRGDMIALILPAAMIFFGPALWNLLSGKRPIISHGVTVFFMEGFVEILETISSYVSSTVSFLRVGAFALSHAVLSFIVFRFSAEVSGAPGGVFFSLIIMVFGNAVIIVLEGMIVAIQVVRLQYYEFFSKFFTETGVEFNPFRFRKGGL